MTGNNRLEFPAGRGDVCTDPACYRAKCKAAEAKAAGQSEATDEEDIPVAEIIDDEPEAAGEAPTADPLKQIETHVRKLRHLHKDHHARVQLDIILDQYAQILLGNDAR
jgi:hypothetical protein